MILTIHITQMVCIFVRCIYLQVFYYIEVIIQQESYKFRMVNACTSSYHFFKKHLLSYPYYPYICMNIPIQKCLQSLELVNRTYDTCNFTYLY